MGIQSISSNPVSQSLNQAGDNTAMGKEDFLKLLISQMQHQDPLEPMKNSEFVAQLATFSNVEQLVSVNEGITGLQGITSAAYDSQSAAFIGKDVEVISNQLSLNNYGDQVQTGFQLQQNADTVIVNFRDAGGQIVRSMDLGPQSQGDVSLTWNGLADDGQQLPPGLYRIDVMATDQNGNPIPYQSKIRGTVDGVSYENGSPELLIGAARASVSNIIGVYPKGTI